MAKFENRKEKMLMILLEHLGGLRYEELMQLATERGIGSRRTINKQLKELCEKEYVVRNELGRYVINIAEGLLKPIRKCFHEIPKQVENFVDNLIMAYVSSKDADADAFLRVGGKYVIYKSRMIMLYTSTLFPYLFDKQFSELYYMGHKYALDLLIGSLDKLAQKLKGITLKDFLLDKEVREKHLLPHFEDQYNRLKTEIRLDMQEIEKLVNQLSVEESLKRNLKKYV